jgi:hypothetical protein
MNGELKISWSGCKDSQTSADATEAGKATGAMSYAFIHALSEYPSHIKFDSISYDYRRTDQNPQQSYIQLLNSIRWAIFIISL